MKVPRAALTTSFLILVLQLFSTAVRRGLFNLLGEQLASNIIFAVLVAAAMTATVWSVVKRHKDLLSLALTSGIILYLLLSRPVFEGRFSLFLFFILGVVSVLDEKRTAKWAPIVLIAGVAFLCEWLPGLLFGSLRFYWLDCLSMCVGGLSGRLVACSNR